jgi:exosome complex RNA-binding protein Rrp42 (RNase PH superfamily)
VHNSSNVLPLSSLVIEPGKAAWVVYLDIVCLNYDGGVLDAAVLAAVAALRNRTLINSYFRPFVVRVGPYQNSEGGLAPRARPQ